MRLTSTPQLAGLVAAISLTLAPAALAQSKPPLPKAQIEIDAVYLAGATTINDAATPRINAENAQVSATYDIPSSFGFSGGFGYRLWKNLAVGFAVSHFSASADAAIAGAIPHPFTFAQLRQIEGTATDLTHREISVGIQARGIFPLSRALTLTVHAGPAYSSLEQTTITSINYSEAYPYDTATFQSAVSETNSESVWGVGAGADLAYFFSKQVGAGIGIRYSGGEVTLPSLYGGTIDSKVGGFQIAAGARFRF